MIEVEVYDPLVRSAAEEGMDAFIEVFRTAIDTAVDGELTAEKMSQLNSDQVTLLAYCMLRDEVMDGGFVQLIHNGYGEFIFLNPFAKAIKEWGLRDLSKMIYDAHTLFNKYKDEIERECSDKEFMEMFEKYPEFDDLDDRFVENEEEWTAMVARYIDEHIERFAKVVGE